MATINGHDWVEQNGFHLQMWEVPKLGRVVLFKPSAGAGYWDSYSSDDLQDEDDEGVQELREEYWATVDEYESNRESGWTECDADQLDDQIGTAMQITGRQIDDEEADGESSEDEGQVISIDITDDEARINEEVRLMNHEAQVGLETDSWSAKPPKKRGGRMASIHIRRSTGQINVSICL